MGIALVAFSWATVLPWWLALHGLARPEVDSGDLFFIADLAKTSKNQVVLAVGNENGILTHLPLLLTSAHLAEGGGFVQHLVVVCPPHNAVPHAQLRMLAIYGSPRAGGVMFCWQPGLADGIAHAL